MAVCTVHVRVPYGVTEKEIVEILKQKAGDVRSWNFSNSRKKSRGEVTGWGNLQFKLREDAERACHLSASNSLILRGTNLVVTFAKKDLSRSPTHEVVRWTKSRFWGGCLVSPTRFKQLWAPEVETVTELDFGAKLLRLLFKIDNAWEYQMEFPMKDSLKIIPLMGEHKQSRSFVLQVSPLLGLAPALSPALSLQQLLSDWRLPGLNRHWAASSDKLAIDSQDSLPVCTCGGFGLL